MTRYVMIINLHDCVGCGTCEIACKVENEIPEGVFVSYHENKMSGKFPDVEYSYRPVMCNHCANAACVAACPTGAMHKDEFGLTVHNLDACVACRRCAGACPYHAITPAPENTAVSDITAVPALIKDCTASGIETVGESGADKATGYPMHDPALDEYNLPVVRVGSPLKCQMCKHLVYHGDVPRCVEACPAGARVFGDEEDIYGDIHNLQLDYDASVMAPENGTEPHVYYIREFGKTW